MARVGRERGVRHRSFLRSFLYPTEWLVGASLLTMVLLYWWSGERFFNLGSLFFERLLSLLPCYGAALLLTLLIKRLRALPQGESRHHTWRAFRSEYFTPASLLRDLRLLQAVTLLFVVFISLKHLIPRINPALHDTSLLRWEEEWFGGRLISEWLFGALSPAAAPFLSEVYLLFYPYIAVLLFTVIMNRNDAEVHRFFTAFTLTWLVGIGVVYLLPTWGPVFFVPERFRNYPATGVQRMQEQLWWAKVAYEERGVRAPFLISGFPSLHFAVTLLGACAARRTGVLLFIFAASFCVLTFVSTLYFGWHYLIDNIGAGLLVVLSCWIAKQLINWGWGECSRRANRGAE